jgi:pimeloyl-ACP methyl ester carboxylesterase
MKKVLYFIGVIIIAGIIAVISVVRFDIPVEKLKTKYANQNSRFINIDGLSVHYRDEGKGFPVVLLHEAASSLQTWDGWTKRLARHYRVIRLDLPGYGLTGPNANKDYSMRWYVDFLDAFLRKLNIRSCCLAGNSLGGHVAIEFAFEYKDLVRKLILIDSGGYPLEERGILAAEMARNPLFRPIVRYVTPRFFVAMNVREAYGTSIKVPDDTIDRYYELLLRKGNRDTFITTCNRKPEDSSAHIRTIRIPTLILWGKDDRIIPVRYAEHFHRDIPSSRLIVYGDVGHVPQEEIPEKTASDVLSFLDQQGVARDE